MLSLLQYNRLINSQGVTGNMEKASEKRMQLATYILLAVSIIVMYMTHREIYFMMDDLWYSTMLSDDTPVASLNDVIVSQIWHYNNWGGRSMTHGILQLVLMAGEQVADILNVLVTMVLALLICIVAEKRKLLAFFAAAAMPLGLNANWKMSMFWQSGAANYLYITVFILGFVYCYLREFADRPDDGTPFPDGVSDEGVNARKKDLPGITLWIIPLGLLAGWSNENMGPAVWILSLVVILAAIKEKRKLHLWMILGNLTCLFGSVMMIIAPGNFVRSAQTWDDKGLLWKFYLRCYSEAKGAMEYLFPTLLILTLMLILARGVEGVRIGRRNGLLLFCALLSWGAMILSPHYPDRAAFGTMTLLICVIVSLAGRILEKRQELKWPFWFGILLVWLKGMYFCCEHIGLSWGWIV